MPVRVCARVKNIVFVCHLAAEDPEVGDFVSVCSFSSAAVCASVCIALEAATHTNTVNTRLGGDLLNAVDSKLSK